MRPIWALALVATVAFAASLEPSLKIYFQVTMTDQGYQQRAFTKAAARWKTPAKFPEAGKKAVVQAVIAKDGKLVSAMLTMPSGSDAWDKAVLAMVKGAAPYEPLPKSYGYPTVEAHFHVTAQPKAK